MAYRADIEIGVTGAARLKELQDRITRLSRAIDDANIKTFIDKKAVQSLAEYSGAAGKAAANLRETAIQLNAAGKASGDYANAISQLVTAIGQENSALQLQNNLIKEEIELRRKQKLASAGIRETTQYGGPIGPGAASPVGALVGQTSPVEERIKRIIRATEEQAQLEAGLLRLEQKSAEALNKQLQARGQLNRLAAVAVGTARALANAPAAQLLLAPSAPGAPAMSGGARRRITGSVERLGGARTEDQAAMALRFAQALEEQVRPLSQIQALYAGIAGQAVKLQGIKALPDSTMLNASARGIKQLELGQDSYNRELKESADRIQQLDRLEESRARRARKLQDRQAYFNNEPASSVAGPGGFGTAMRGRAGGAISSAIIGGGFPLLFGQGAAAATGGALGGLAGGLLGGGFGFALSIAGTAIGDIITQSETLNKSLANLNSSLSSTGNTSTTTADDIKSLAKTLQITNDEALKLVNTFSQFGDAQTREALATLFGGVGGAATFEAIARAGIDEKNALSSIFELRKYIGTEAANQLALQLNTVGATQTQAALLKLVVERSIQSAVAAKSQVQFTDNLLSTWENIVAGIAGALSLAIQFIQKMREGSLLRLPFLDQVAAALEGVRARSGKQIATQNAAELEKQMRAAVEAAMRGLTQETGALGLQSALQDQYTAKPKGPESRAGQLKEELAAIVAIGEAEDRIRDLQFQGRDYTALAAEEDKIRADIERDRVKALLSANYASEKGLINQIALARLENLRLETADKARAINQKKFEDELQAAAAVRQSVQSFVQIRKEQEFQAQYAKTYNRLVTEGLLPAEAQRIANYEKMIAQQLDAVAEQIKITDLAIIEAKARGASTVELEKQLKIYKDQQDAIKGEAAKGPGEGPTDRQRLEDQIAKLRGELNTLTDPINQITAAAEGIGSAFANSFKGVVSGAMTAQEALSSFFQSVADRFLDMAAQIIAKWIEMTILNSVLSLFPGGGMGLGGATAAAGKLNPAVGFGVGPIGFRAAGGPVSAGSPYIVGEKGPELFVPGRSGGIVPNDSLGMGSANVVVNVDASGSSVQGDGNQANQLGKAIGIAVQQELIKQKRPGGLLA